jgi:excisionase family DNA binding protein
MDTQPLAYRIPDAMAAIGIGRTKIYELVAQGHLRAIRVAGRTLIDAASLRELVTTAPTLAPRTPHTPHT